MKYLTFIVLFFTMSPDANAYLQVSSIVSDSNGVIYASTMDQRGILSSHDSGESFKSISSTGINTKIIAINHDNTLFAGTTGDGILRTDDGGSSWVWLKNSLASLDIWTFLFLDNSELLVGTERGLFHSFDNGTSWQAWGFDDYAVKALVRLPNGDLLAGAGINGIFRSTDKGHSWNPITSAPSGSIDIVHLAVAPDGTIYASAWGNGVYRSLDNGVTWESSLNRSPGTYSSATIFSVVFDPAGRAYAVSPENIACSPDKGQTWNENCFTDLPDSEFGSLFFGENGLVILGTWGNGIYYSDDNGKTWEKSSEKLSLGEISIESLQTNNLGTVYAGTENGIYISDDDGIHYQSDGLSGLKVISIAIGNNGYIFAGTEGEGLYRKQTGYNQWVSVFQGTDGTGNIRACIGFGINSVLCGTDNGVYESTDNGETWRLSGFEGKLISHLALSPSGDVFSVISGDGIFRRDHVDKNWYLTSNDTAAWKINDIKINKESDIFVAGHHLNIMRSTDNGASWTRLQTPDHNPYDLTDTTLSSICFDNENSIYITGNNWLFISNDNGDSWDDEIWSGTISNVYQLLVLPGGTILIGIPNVQPRHVDTSGIFRSTNRAMSWKRVLPDVYYVPMRVHDLTVSDGGKVYGATEYYGVMETDNDGRSFHCIGLEGSDIYDVEPVGEILYAGTANEGVFRSTNGGSSWYQFNDGLGSHPWVRSLQQELDGTLYAGTDNGIFSLDPDADWIQLGLEGESIYDICSSKNSLFAAAGTGGMFRSRDQGKTWEAVNPKDIACKFVDIEYDENDDTLYAASYGYSVYKSNDNGDSWIDLSLNSTEEKGRHNAYQKRITIGPDGEVLCAMQGGIFRYDDTDNQWYQYCSYYINTWVSDAVFSGDNLIVSTWHDQYGSGNSGLFASADKGQTWITGVYNLPSDTIEDVEPVVFDLSSFPNPFNSVVTIQYSVEIPENINISVYNILGQRIDIIFEGFRDAGSYNTVWNASELSSGLYFVVLKSRSHKQAIKTTLIR